MVRTCSLLGIAKGTYYYAKDPQERFKEKYAHMRTHVDNIIRKNSSYGIRRIHKALKHKGIDIGRDTLGVLLKLWGLSLRRKTKPRTRSVIERILAFLRDRSNLLANMKLTAPLQVVTSDITELWYANGTRKCYLAVHKDAYGQYVYGWNVAVHMETKLVLKSFTRAVRYLKKKLCTLPKDIVFHQDRGSQYTSYAYVDTVLRVGTLSYSSPGTPTDNGGQESFFGRFKDEWRDDMSELQDIQKVERFIRNKIQYYNHHRLHTSIGYQTPFAFTKSVLIEWGKWFSESRT